jgi:hypothetical protein
MHSQYVLTAWQTIYLPAIKCPKTSYHSLRPRLHRSGPPGLINHPPHASTASCDVISALFGDDCTKWLTWIDDHLASCDGTSENVLLTICDSAYTEVSAQSGSTITSCYQASSALNGNLHLRMHQVFSQPGEQSTFLQCNIRRYNTVVCGHAYTEVIGLVW